MCVVCGEKPPMPELSSLDWDASLPPVQQQPTGVEGRALDGECSREVVRLSWRVLPQQQNNLGSQEFELLESHILYRLCQGCIQYLRAHHPPETLTPCCCAIPTKITGVPKDVDRITQVPPCFGTLANLLADKCSFLFANPASTFTLTVNRTSVLDYILCGILTVSSSSWDHCSTCVLGTSERGLQEADLYQVLFLDVIIGFWRSECYRRASGARWSPMPWSQTSQQELAALPKHTKYETTIFNEEDLVNEDEPIVSGHRIIFGCPSDIPWLGAPHDGYPFCPTLSSYTAARRGAAQSLRDDAALWVSALTFGLLEAVTRTRISEATLVSPGSRDGEFVLSGNRILRFLVHWHCTMHSRAPDSMDNAHLEHGREVAHVLQRALRALDEEWPLIGSMLARGGFPRHKVAEMVYAIALTVVPLCGVSMSVWKMLPEMAELETATKDHLRYFFVVVREVFKARMLRAGWCANTLSHQFMLSLIDIPVMSNLVRLAPFIRDRPDEHKDCTESTCVFYTIVDTAAYVPTHVDSTCTCEYVRPSLDDVKRLLAEGSIPAVVYDGAGLGVQPATVGTYVAISHVWADGMGSTTEVGLPTCQVARIADLTKRVLPESDGAFWMDSLCVPEVAHLRKHAIKLMADTYRDAAKVLVIDECIRRTCSEAKSWEENMFRIATSGWMRRVWTLQEGVLARELYMNFIEGPVLVEERNLLLKVRPGHMDSSHLHIPHQRGVEWLWGHALCCLVPILAYRFCAQAGVTPANTTARRREVAKLLELRSTTKPEDEIIAIAALLPLDVDALLAVPGPDVAQGRIRECLLQLREVSKRVVLHACTPHLDLPNFRWATRSLSETIGGSSFDEATAVCTKNGLVGEFFVAALEEPVSVSEDAAWRQTPFVHFDSSATRLRYSLSVHTDVMPYHLQSESMDALLFMHGDLTPVVGCAAIRWSRRETGAEDGQLPEARLEYIAPCTLMQQQVDGPSSTSIWRSQTSQGLAIGELRAMRVLLT